LQLTDAAKITFFNTASGDLARHETTRNTQVCTELINFLLGNGNPIYRLDYLQPTTFKIINDTFPPGAAVEDQPQRFFDGSDVEVVHLLTPISGLIAECHSVHQHGVTRIVPVRLKGFIRLDDYPTSHDQQDPSLVMHAIQNLIESDQINTQFPQEGMYGYATGVHNFLSYTQENQELDPRVRDHAAKLRLRLLLSSSHYQAHQELFAGSQRLTDFLNFIEFIEKPTPSSTFSQAETFPLIHSLIPPRNLVDSNVQEERKTITYDTDIIGILFIEIIESNGRLSRQYVRQNHAD